MPVGYYFSPPNMTTDQYDETTRRLEQAGQGSPDGAGSRLVADSGVAAP